MSDALAAGISAAGQIGATWLGNTISANSAQKINRLQLQNQKQMYDKQIELANTAHQREVRDLRAAGLNPILSATGGQGAASPAAGSVDLQNPDAAWSNLGENVGSAAKTFGQLMNKGVERSLMESRIVGANAEAENSAESASRTRIQRQKEQMELEFWQHNPDFFKQAMIEKNTSGNPLTAARSLGMTLDDRSYSILSHGWDWLKSSAQRFKNFMTQPREAEHGGETINVPSAMTPAQFEELYNKPGNKKLDFRKTSPRRFNYPHWYPDDLRK